MLLGRSVSDPMMWGIPHRIAVRMFVDILASVETAAHRVAGTGLEERGVADRERCRTFWGHHW